MRYIMTFIVSIALMQMAFYVLGNMGDAGYTFLTATVVGVIFAILALMIGESTVPDTES